MRIAYFDCFAGIAGDMTVGALLDAGLDFDLLRGELGKLGVGGYRLERTTVKRHSIAGTKFTVYLDGQEHPTDHPHNHHDTHGHSHEHGRPSAQGSHRRLGDVVEIIKRADLSSGVKARTTRIFTRLAEAEAKVHASTIDEVHFHEVGAVDAIVDIVGACVGLEALGIEQVYASPIRVGTGLVTVAHGVMPLPAPGTLELLRGVPVEHTDIPFELVTPTGAAIITTIASHFGPPPVFMPQRIGYGAGGRDLDEIANLLRVEVGETALPASSTTEERVLVIETNIDSMTPEVYGYVMEQLLAAGAKDVVLIPVIMKKNRPGIIVQVLADETMKDALVAILFRETPTLGVRMAPMTRRILPRQAGTVETPWGPVRTKRVEWDGHERVTPEYDDCAAIARQHGVPILTVYEAVRRATSLEDAR